MRRERISSACLLTCSLAIVLTSFGNAFCYAESGGSEFSGRIAGLNYVETLTDGADVADELPMVIAMHFMAGSPATSIAQYGDLDVPVRVLSLAGPHEFDDGFSWFPDGYYELDAASQLEVTIETAERVFRFIHEATQTFPTLGKPILVGYSQGADLIHMIALRQPDSIQAGLPMGGRFPDEWQVDAPLNTDIRPQIFLFHGATDAAVDVGASLAAATYYVRNGATVSLHVYAGVGHGYPEAMKTDYQSAIRRLVGAASD